MNPTPINDLPRKWREEYPMSMGIHNNYSRMADNFAAELEAALAAVLASNSTSETPLSVTVGEGKYTVRQDADGRLSALRYGEPWRDCCGDSLIYTLASELAQTKAALAAVQEAARLLREHPIMGEHPADERGECRCMQCQWYRKVNRFFALPTPPAQ